jgi:hypothetical protein
VRFLGRRLLGAAPTSWHPFGHRLQKDHAHDRAAVGNSIWEDP